VQTGSTSPCSPSQGGATRRSPTAALDSFIEEVERPRRYRGWSCRGDFASTSSSAEVEDARLPAFSCFPTVTTTLDQATGVQASSEAQPYQRSDHRGWAVAAGIRAKSRTGSFLLGRSTAETQAERRRASRSSERRRQDILASTATITYAASSSAVPTQSWARESASNHTQQHERAEHGQTPRQDRQPRSVAFASRPRAIHGRRQLAAPVIRPSIKPPRPLEGHHPTRRHSTCARSRGLRRGFASPARVWRSAVERRAGRAGARKAVHHHPADHQHQGREGVRPGVMNRRLGEYASPSSLRPIKDLPEVSEVRLDEQPQIYQAFIDYVKRPGGIAGKRSARVQAVHPGGECRLITICNRLTKTTTCSATMRHYFDTSGDAAAVHGEHTSGCCLVDLNAEHPQRAPPGLIGTPWLHARRSDQESLLEPAREESQSSTASPSS